VIFSELTREKKTILLYLYKICLCKNIYTHCPFWHFDLPTNAKNMSKTKRSSYSICHICTNKVLLFHKKSIFPLSNDVFEETHITNWLLLFH
jgi:hypothetical protein